jgi:hypothetical protein
MYKILLQLKDYNRPAYIFINLIILNAIIKINSYYQDKTIIRIPNILLYTILLQNK